MDDRTGLLEQARQRYRAREWVEARRRFTAAREAAPLSPDDLYALSNCAGWLGALDEALVLQQEAHRHYLQHGRPREAALAALDIGYTYALQHQEAQASGWMARAYRLLEDEPEGFEHGYLAYIDFETAFEAGRLDEASSHVRRVQELGQRHGDPNLQAMALLARGRVLIREGRVHEGIVLLDEAMVAATSDELDPAWAGNIYCHLMRACYEITDLRRAGEWTEATARWCEAMPGAGPFMGICRVHRAQILQLQGRWEQAEREALGVCEGVPHFDVGNAAEAHYEVGEVRRQRGDLAGAEAAYQDARRLGREPQPGLSLLRLAQGQVAEATASMRSALAAAANDPAARARLLPSAVKIFVESHDLDQARAAARELTEAAGTYDTAALRASAAVARGLLMLAERRPEAAVAGLREALQGWQTLGIPYEAACTRLLLARAYEGLGDAGTAALERHTAEAALAALGVHAPRSEGPPDPSRGRRDGLTAREVEILGMVALGKTNQEIAADLVLSVRTVERHLATVYQKLGLRGRSARAAAVSYAFHQDVITR